MGVKWQLLRPFTFVLLDDCVFSHLRSYCKRSLIISSIDPYKKVVVNDRLKNNDNIVFKTTFYYISMALIFQL